jgi:hypothetical protein
MTATGSVCSKCHARKYEAEEGWTQNGDGVLCWYCSPPLHKGKEDVEGEGEGYVDVHPSVLPIPIPNEVDDGEPIVTWLLRAHKAGEVQPEPVELPPPPPSATPSMKAVAEFFALVYGLRFRAPRLARKPVPFGCDWVGGYVGLSGRGVWDALQRLVACGVLKRVDERLPTRPEELLPNASEKKRPVHLYLPGDGAS